MVDSWKEMQSELEALHHRIETLEAESQAYSHLPKRIAELEGCIQRLELKAQGVPPSPPPEVQRLRGALEAIQKMVDNDFIVQRICHYALERK